MWGLKQRGRQVWPRATRRDLRCRVCHLADSTGKDGLRDRVRATGEDDAGAQQSFRTEICEQVDEAGAKCRR